MPPEAIGLIGIVVLFALLIIGMPIGFAMALVGFVGYGIIAGFQGALTNLATVPYRSVSSYVFSVLPLFMLMGEIASTSGFIEGAYGFLHKLLGRLRGGLAVSTIGACSIFAAVCGSSLASAATMCRIAYPEMNRYKYSPKLSLASIAAGGTIGILIPPSIPMIVYALFAEESVGRLFMAGFIPGVLLASLMVLTIYLRVKLNPSLAPQGPVATWREKMSASMGVIPLLLLALFVLGGIWGGIFSPTEAGGIGAFGAFVIALCKRQLNLSKTFSALTNTMTTTAMVCLILIGAMIFNYFIVVSGLAAALARSVEMFHLPPHGVLVIILVIWLILGCLMDTMAMQMLTLPIFLPIIRSLGFDTVWFGIVFVIMCEMALITPPIGMNVFIIHGMAKDVPMYTIFRGLVPFLLALVLCLVLLIIFPQIALFLPNIMIGS